MSTYLYKLKKIKREYNEFSNLWTNTIFPLIKPRECIRLRTYSHIAERTYERDHDPAFIQRLLSYSFEHNIDKFLIDGSVAIIFRNEMAVIVDIDQVEGRFQREYNMRVTTVIDSDRVSSKNRINISFDQLMQYKPLNTVPFPKPYLHTFNFDSKLEKARQRIHEFIDKLAAHNCCQNLLSAV